MATIRDMGSRGATLNQIDPRKIEVMPSLNARDMNSAETRAHIASLADSIQAQGFLGSHPLEVFTESDRIYVAAGHCRLAACLLVIERGQELLSVPCLSEARGTSPYQRLLNQISSNTGQRLNLGEEGRVYHKLIAMGYVVSRIAKDAGRSESHIRQALDFNAAPTEAHQLVSDGKVSATLAAETIRKEGPKAGVAKLKAAVKTAEKAGKGRATKQHITGQTKVPKASNRVSDDTTELQTLRALAKTAVDAWELGLDLETIDAMRALREALSIAEGNAPVEKIAA